LPSSYQLPESVYLLECGPSLERLDDRSVVGLEIWRYHPQLDLAHSLDALHALISLGIGRGTRTLSSVWKHLNGLPVALLGIPVGTGQDFPDLGSVHVLQPLVDFDRCTYPDRLRSFSSGQGDDPKSLRVRA
jgi:hypothetical protein